MLFGQISQGRTFEIERTDLDWRRGLLNISQTLQQFSYAKIKELEKLIED